MTMHQVEDKTIAQAVLRLGTLRVQRKEIEKAEKKLKPMIREYMTGKGLKRMKTFEGAQASLDPGSRTYLDKDLICTTLGVKDLKAFEFKKETTPALTCSPPKGSKKF